MGREGFEPSTLGLRDRSIQARPLFYGVLRCREVLPVRSDNGSSGHRWDTWCTSLARRHAAAPTGRRATWSFTEASARRMPPPPARCSLVSASEPADA